MGHYVGVAENVGGTLTYKVLTSDTRQVIFRSVVRPADAERNLRAESDKRGHVGQVKPAELLGYLVVSSEEKQILKRTDFQ